MGTEHLGESHTARHQSEMGRDIVGAPLREGALHTEESAHIHRDLAIGNFFVTLRRVAAVTRELLDHVLNEQKSR